MSLPHQPAILVVDDVPEIAEYVRATLSRLPLPVDVITASDPEQARRLAASRDFDLVMTDYRMPALDGLTILLAARERNRGGRRVLMTGYNELPEDASRIRDAGLDAFIQKPIPAQDLLLLVGDMLAADPDVMSAYRQATRELELLHHERGDRA